MLTRLTLGALAVIVSGVFGGALLFVSAQGSTSTPEPAATPIIVVPDDDPAALRCEIEFVAVAHERSLVRVLARLRTPAVFDRTGDGYEYATNCFLLGMEKAGYILWRHGRAETIIRDDGGDFYVWGLFEQP